jgi:hypothetical protein
VILTFFTYHKVLFYITIFIRSPIDEYLSHFPVWKTWDPTSPTSQNKKWRTASPDIWKLAWPSARSICIILLDINTLTKKKPQIRFFWDYDKMKQSNFLKYLMSLLGYNEWLLVLYWLQMHAGLSSPLIRFIETLCHRIASTFWQPQCTVNPYFLQATSPQSSNQILNPIIVSI